MVRMSIASIFRELMPASAGFLLDLCFVRHGFRHENILSNREDTDLPTVGLAPCMQTTVRGSSGAEQPENLLFVCHRN
jgi:hypothetical protein